MWILVQIHLTLKPFLLLERTSEKTSPKPTPLQTSNHDNQHLLGAPLVSDTALNTLHASSCFILTVNM